MNFLKKGSRYAIALILVLAISLITEKEAYARRYFFMDIPELNYKFSYENEIEKRSAQGVETESESNTFFEGIHLKSTGWVYHPALLEYELSLSPEWEQWYRTSSGAKTESRDFLQGYFTEVRILQYKPYSFNMFAGRSTMTISSNFTSRSKRNTDTYGSIFTLKFPVLPTIFSYSHLKSDQTGFFAFNEETDSMGLQLNYYRNLGISKVDASFKDTETTTRGNVVGNTEKKVNFNNEYRFTRNRMLRSDIRYRTADGDSAGFEKYSVRENFVWDHRRNLRTSYKLGYSDQAFESSRTESKNLGFNLQHILYENLTTNFNMRGSKIQFDDGREDEYGSSLHFNYVRKIPWGSLNVNMGHSYLINEIDRTEKNNQIFEEPVTFAPGKVTLLENQNIIIDSIIVKSEASHVPLEEYEPGVDYEVTEMGSYVRISRIVTGQIAPDQTVIVDYEYLANPTYDFSTFTRNYGFNLYLLKVWNVFYSLHLKEERFIKGIRPDELVNDTIHTAGTDFTWRWTKTSLVYTDSQTTNLPKTKWNAEEVFTFMPNRKLFFTVSGRYGETNFKDRGEVENFLGFDSILQYFTSSASKVTLEAFWLKASGAVDETITSKLSALYEISYRALRGTVEYAYLSEENRIEQDSTTNQYITFMLKTKEF
jgi:hypothetical protein